MKKIITLLFIISGVSLYAQNMHVHKTDGSSVSITIQDIDSITFGEAIMDPDQNDTIGTFTDPRDGEVYKWVKIGDQIWMAENLAYLPSVNQVADGSEDVAGSYYYVYGYDGTDLIEAKATSNYKTYGVLYNWSAAMNGEASSTSNPSGIQGVCPTGWHLPSYQEWVTLSTYLGGTAVAGGKLKSNDTISWIKPNIGATNESGFSALAGGFRRDYDESFSQITVGSFFRCTSINPSTDPHQAYVPVLLNTDESILFGYGDANGASIRCIKN